MIYKNMYRIRNFLYQQNHVRHGKQGFRSIVGINRMKPTINQVHHHHDSHFSSSSKQNIRHDVDDVDDSKSTNYWWDDFQKTHGSKINALPEVQAMEKLIDFLKVQDNLQRQKPEEENSLGMLSNPTKTSSPSSSSDTIKYKYTMTPEHHLQCIDVAMATFSLHVHARIAALVGHGYYTIGPCGEELLASAGLAFQNTTANDDDDGGGFGGDTTALHYRHSSVSIMRQLLQLQQQQQQQQQGQDKKNNDGQTMTTTKPDISEMDLSSSHLLEKILLGRARGYTVSKYDPVTGGVHCCIGGGKDEYMVTSTLSSQCPAAVGRALGFALAARKSNGTGTTVDTNIISPSPDNDNHNTNQKSKRPISFTTIGDGSVHNHHFLSSLTLARHAKHLKVKCPIVFGISNNGWSISYDTKNYIDTVFGNDTDGNSTIDPLLPVFRADGQDLQSVYDQTMQACDYARKYQSPCILLYSNIVRRFGHAATDRQHVYISSDEIQSMQDTCVIQNAIIQAVDKLQLTTYRHLLDRLQTIHYLLVNQAFAQAITEPKVTLDEMLEKVSVPLTRPSPDDEKKNTKEDNFVKVRSVSIVSSEGNNASATDIKYVVEDQKVQHDEGKERRRQLDDIDVVEKPQVMRKHMTRIYHEILENDPSVIYIGEDVKHGGYYLVTEGLVDKLSDNNDNKNHHHHHHRVIDFPPDETTLLGVGLGFSQLGLLPIVEIPYAKYLDCGIDMFNEIAIQNWLSPSSSTTENDDDDTDHQNHTHRNHRKTGMIIRLQGFDYGIFGGNFHTHNMLNHIPPGIDVVCYSNGIDYVNGLRYVYEQVKNGRIVMIVDCTNLLNLRHIHTNINDRSWEFRYPRINTTTTDNDNNHDDENDDMNSNSMLDFDSVIVYTGDDNVNDNNGIGEEDDAENMKNQIIVNERGTTTKMKTKKIAIISYGNGIITSLQARRKLVDRNVIQSESELDIIDCPYLSFGGTDVMVPKGLQMLLLSSPSTTTTTTTSSSSSSKSNDNDNSSNHHYSNNVEYDAILFVDICKNGPGSNVLSSLITLLQQNHLLPEYWNFVAAPRTYNPLGGTVTFLSCGDIENGIESLLLKGKRRE